MLRDEQRDRERDGETDIKQSPRSVLVNQSGLTLVVQYMLLSTIGIDVLSCSYRKRVCT